MPSANKKPAAGKGNDKGKTPKINVAELVDQLKRSLRQSAAEVSAPTAPLIDFVVQHTADPLVPYPPATIVLPPSSSDPRVMRVLLTSLNSRATAAMIAAYKHAAARSICAWTTPLTLSALQSLTSSVRLLQSITTLELVNNGLTAAAVVALRDVLVHRSSNTINNLRLDFNPLGADGLSQIADAMAFNSSITALSLSNCAIQRGGAVHLQRLLTIQDTTLRSLNLSGNYFHTNGLYYIAAALTDPFNMITDIGGVKQCTSTLTSIDYSHNRITPIEVDANPTVLPMFVNVLQTCRRLNRINLDGNSFGVDALTLIADVIPQCTHIVQLVVTPFSDCDAYRTIVAAIRLNQPKPIKKGRKGKGRKKK